MFLNVGTFQISKSLQRLPSNNCNSLIFDFHSDRDSARRGLRDARVGVEHRRLEADTSQFVQGEGFLHVRY